MTVNIISNVSFELFPFIDATFSHNVPRNILKVGQLIWKPYDWYLCRKTKYWTTLNRVTLFSNSSNNDLFFFNSRSDWNWTSNYTIREKVCSYKNHNRRFPHFVLKSPLFRSVNVSTVCKKKRCSLVTSNKLIGKMNFDVLCTVIFSY